MLSVSLIWIAVITVLFVVGMTKLTTLDEKLTTQTNQIQQNIESNSYYLKENIYSNLFQLLHEYNEKSHRPAEKTHFLYAEPHFFLAYFQERFGIRGQKKKFYARNYTDFFIQVRANGQILLEQEFDTIVRIHDPIQYNNTTGFNEDDFFSFELELPDYNGLTDIVFIEKNTLTELQSIPFHIRNERPLSKVAYIANLSTIENYSSGFGLNSNYSAGKLPGRHIISKEYPFNNNTQKENLYCKHYGSIDYKLADFFRENGVKIDFVDTYQFDILLDNYDTIIFGVHDEYWPIKNYKIIQKFIDNGGDVITLGGNSAYKYMYDYGTHWEIENEALPITRDFSFFENYWGSYYDAHGFNTYGPFKVDSNAINHPLLKDVPEYFGLTSPYACTSRGEGASGWETDKMVGSKFIRLAQGQNEGVRAGADIVFRHFENGAKVLNVGSIAFVGSLDEDGVKTFMNNILDFFELKK